jgi:hypothetical protein
VCDPDFGQEVNINESIEKLIEGAPRLKSTDAQMVLRDQYETTYGIYDHSGPGGEDPLALVLMHPSEDTITDGALHERMKEYVECDIHKYFGISFLEFINQPTYVLRMQLEIAQEQIRKEAPIADALRKQLGGLQDNKG